MRILVFTGKGGVGKTSVAAATALRAADLGHRVLVVSTDTAHSLGDSLQQELRPEPVRITDNLDAQEIDVQYSIEKYWGDFQKFMVGLFTRRGVEDVIAEEVTILPGLEEGASLLWLAEYADSGEYDVIVVDAAPTAETLRLLSLPDAARWWVEKLIPLGRTAARILTPIGKPFGVSGPDVEAVNTVQGLFDTLDEVRAMLADSTVSSMRLVVNAERMVIKETQRTFTYLNLYGYPVDAVLCNRLIPDSVTDPYFDDWKARQAANLSLIHEVFDPLPLLTAPLFEREMGGLELLREMGQALYAAHDPAERLYEGRPHTLEQDADGGYTMRIRLPFAQKGQVELFRSADEITLSVGSYRRNIVLPRVLWPLEVESAKLQNGALVVRFAGPAVA
ncbi:MAG TPA: ArsA family ATPase [Aggregatilineales bacterium]|nr:ArsA family ATPase [Aggregatilineales bacterium]